MFVSNPSGRMRANARSTAIAVIFVHTLSLGCLPPVGEGDTDHESDSYATRNEVPGHEWTLDDTEASESESTSSGDSESETSTDTSSGSVTDTTDTDTTDTDPSDTDTTDTDTTDTSDTVSDTDETGDSEGETDDPVWENCAPDPNHIEDPFIDCVEAFDPAGGVNFGHDMMPEIVLGSPEGGGQIAGGTDVAALGCGGSLIAFFDGPGIVDGPGADFIVFENPFEAGQTTFSEPAEVSVSDDLQTWHTFPCEVDGTGTWPATGCAGVHPVLADSMNGIDATNPQTAGGDAFDLADVGVSHAWFVRLVDVTEDYYGNTTWCGGAAGGFDLDAIAVVHEPEP